MSMEDPGLDRHDWTTRFESLEPELREDPQEALPELRRLVEEMLAERGYDLEDPAALEGDDPDVIATFASARELAFRCEAGEAAGPGDVGEAIHGFTAVYEHLNAEHSAP